MLNKTAAVTLVSNPSPTVSTYEWVATNVRSMNRTNKLSSAPFYVPNPISRKHQFRLVLLRGVVKGESPEKDPIGIYLEYLPPSQTDGAPIEHPNHCKVAVWCVNVASVRKSKKEIDGSRDVDNQKRENEDDGTAASLSRGAPHRYEETSFTFTATDRMAGFKEIVPHMDLDEDSVGFLDPNAFNALTIRVEITTGIVSVTDVVAKTTDRWATSFWGSATSALAAIQTGLDALKSQVMSTIDERQEGGEGNAASESQRLLPWQELPAAWGKASRSLAEWEKLITITIVEDDGTFLFGPDRGLHADEQVLMTQLGLNHRAIMNASAVFDYDRDIHEGLLTATTIRKQRYNLVPKHISDKKFWANYMWKVASLSIAPKNDQIHLLLSIVNAPPRVTTDNTNKNNKRGTAASTGGSSGSFSSAAAATRVGVGGGVDQSETHDENYATDDNHSQSDSTSSVVAASVPLLLSFLEQLELDVAKAVKAAVEAVELLEDLVADEADKLLISSALQSCEGCAAKLRDVSSRVDQNTRKLNQQQVRAEKSPQQHQQVRKVLADSNFSERHASLLQGVEATSERLKAAVATAKGVPKTTVVKPTNISTKTEEHDSSHQFVVAASFPTLGGTENKEPPTLNEGNQVHVKDDEHNEGSESNQKAALLVFEEEEEAEKIDVEKNEAKRVYGPVGSVVGVVEKLSDADTVSAIVHEGGAAAAAVGSAISSAFSGFFSSTIAPPLASVATAVSSKAEEAAEEGLITAEKEVPLSPLPQEAVAEDEGVSGPSEEEETTAFPQKETDPSAPVPATVNVGTVTSINTIDGLVDAPIAADVLPVDREEEGPITAVEGEGNATAADDDDDDNDALEETAPQIEEQQHQDEEEEKKTSVEESVEAALSAVNNSPAIIIEEEETEEEEEEEAEEGPGGVEGNVEERGEIPSEGSTSKKSSSSSNDAVEISTDEATAQKSDGEFVVVGSGAGASSSNRDEGQSMRSTTVDQRVSSTSTVPTPKKEEVKSPSAASSTATKTSTKEGAKKDPLGFLNDDDFLDAFATSSSSSPKCKIAVAKAVASPTVGGSGSESTTAATNKTKMAFEPMPWEDEDD